MQHSTVWCTNERNMLCPTILGNVVPTCCVRLHGPYCDGVVKSMCLLGDTDGAVIARCTLRGVVTVLCDRCVY